MGRGCDELLGSSAHSQPGGPKSAPARWPGTGWHCLAVTEHSGGAVRLLQNLGSPNQNKHLSLQAGSPLTWPLLLLSSSVALPPWTRGHRLWTWVAAGWNCSSPGSEGSGGARTFPLARRPELAATRVKGAWCQGQRPGHLKRKWGLRGRPQYRPGGGRETQGIQHIITPQKGRGLAAVRGGGASLQAQGAVPPAGWDPALRCGPQEQGEKRVV